MYLRVLTRLIAVVVTPVWILALLPADMHHHSELEMNTVLPGLANSAISAPLIQVLLKLAFCPVKLQSLTRSHPSSAATLAWVTGALTCLKTQLTDAAAALPLRKVKATGIASEPPTKRRLALTGLSGIVSLEVVSKLSCMVIPVVLGPLSARCMADQWNDKGKVPEKTRHNANLPAVRG